jgi:hypothetical protein
MVIVMVVVGTSKCPEVDVSMVIGRLVLRLWERYLVFSILTVWS